MRRVRSLVPLLCLLSAALPARAQTANLLPNPSFETGAARPDGWTLFAGGNWEFDGRQPSGGAQLPAGGERCVSVTGTGDDSSWWASTPSGLQPDQLYQVSYWVRRQSGGGGTVIAGLNLVNRDASAGSEWERREFFFRAPRELEGAFFRLGQWHSAGVIRFDDAALIPAVVVHRGSSRGMVLGAGETVTAGRYTARHLLGGPGSTDFRCLDRFTAAFNSNRWVFSGPAEVIYRHSLARLPQTEAEVEVNVNWRERGSLIVEAGRDGRSWVRLGEVGELKRVAFPIPGELLPAREVYVRLRSEGDTSLQVDDYRYRCRLPEADSVGRAVGESQYLGVLRRSPDLEVQVEELGDLLPAGSNQAELLIRNRGPRRSLRLAVVIEKAESVVSQCEQAVPIAAGATQRVRLGYDLNGPGQYTLRLFCAASGSEPLWEARGDFMVPPLYDSGGELLSEDARAAIWWCEPERKVSRTRGLPKAKGLALRLSAAGNEYEAAQLVLAARAPLTGCQVTAADLVADSGARLPASEIEIRSVEYVPVTDPTDEVGAPGEWPDPLPLHRGPVDLPAGQNQAFWITVHVPEGTPEGDYCGEIRVSANGWSQEVPVVVHVWGFDLPRETHVRSGFGLSPRLIKRYHNLQTEEEVQQVFDLYLRSFASHRVAPYSVGREIAVTWTKAPSGEVVPQIDFTSFDAAARHALDELGFNSFVLHLPGLGGGTFHSRYLGEIAGHQQGTPEHEAAFTRYLREVQSHLAQQGWLDKAYIYWFDEPEPKDFDFVREGMRLIHRAGPRLTRMLTTHPNPALHGDVDLWCLPTSTLDPEVVAQRKKAGEEIWWYLCTGPKAPYFTLFLDHYGTEMRLWLWETWKYGLDGILVWETNYWTSEAAYPPPSLQNPWQDPMSWTSGYGLSEGARQPWGNGDGRFFYPPNRDPADTSTKYLEGPVPSIRWELLRDGVEDYEYFWLLRSEVERLKQSGADPSAYAEAERLLDVPAEVCADLTHFALTPEPIHSHRARLAQAIEQLRQR